ncbi:unnamed protein product [Calypogeia fissa]
MGAEVAVNQAFASIKPVPYGSSPFAAVNKNQLRMLYFLFNKNFEKVLRIIDNCGVTSITANPSGRVVFQSCLDIFHMLDRPELIDLATDELFSTSQSHLTLQVKLLIFSTSREVSLVHLRLFTCCLDVA